MRVASSSISAVDISSSEKHWKIFASDGAGSIFENMKKKAVFTMNIADKVFGAFGQAEDGI